MTLNGKYIEPNGLHQGDDFGRNLGRSNSSDDNDVPLLLVTNSRQVHREGLDNRLSRSKIPGILAKLLPPPNSQREPSGYMTPKSPAPSQSVDAKQPCKHLRVQIVSRDEDSEYVECLECREVFESSEFKDMNIEESAPESEV